MMLDGVAFRVPMSLLGGFLLASRILVTEEMKE